MQMLVMACLGRNISIPNSKQNFGPSIQSDRLQVARSIILPFCRLRWQAEVLRH